MNLAGALLALALVMLGVWWLAALDGWLGGRATAAGALAAPLRSAARDLFKEFRCTEAPDRVLWLGGPLLLVTAVLAALAVMPLAPGLIGADLSVGVVYFTALFALVTVAVFATAWGPNSKYSLIAGYRFVGLMLAYEMPFAITLIAVALPAQSLALGRIVAEQQTLLWNIALQPLGFLIYLVCALALSFWGPLGVIDSRDIAGGAELELSGAPRLVWRFGHYALLLALAALAVPLFLGGGAGPLLPDAAWTIVKTLAMGAGLLFAAHRLARLKLDRFMEWAWIFLIPLSLFNIFLVGLVMLVFRGFFASVGQ